MRFQWLSTPFRKSQNCREHKTRTHLESVHRCLLWCSKLSHWALNWIWARLSVLVMSLSPRLSIHSPDLQSGLLFIFYIQMPPPQWHWLSPLSVYSPEAMTPFMIRLMSYGTYWLTYMLLPSLQYKLLEGRDSVLSSLYFQGPAQSLVTLQVLKKSFTEWTAKYGRGWTRSKATIKVTKGSWHKRETVAGYTTV